MDKETTSILKKLCKCHECPLFGICPEFGYKLTEKDIEHLRKQMKE